MNTAKSKAADYLASKIHLVTDPLQMAILAHALSIAGHSRSYDAFLRLVDMRREGEIHIRLYYRTKTELSVDCNQV